MALKYGITTKTFEPVAAESILDSVEGMNSALQDIAQCEGCLAEAEVVMENLQKALDTISEFGVGEESLGILDSDGSLQAVLNLQAPALESLESMSEQALEALDQKWEKALEGAMSDAWEKVKKFFKELWDKIKKYATQFWNWLTGLFSKTKKIAEDDKKATADAKDEAKKAGKAAEADKAAQDVMKTEPKGDTASASSAPAEKAAPAAAPTVVGEYKGAMELLQTNVKFKKVVDQIMTLCKKAASDLKSKGLAGVSAKSLGENLKAFGKTQTELMESVSNISGISLLSDTELDNGVEHAVIKFWTEVKSRPGTPDQNGWKSENETQGYMDAFNQIKPDTGATPKLVDALAAEVNKAIDDVDKMIADDSEEDGPEIAAAARATAAAFRKYMLVMSNTARQLYTCQTQIYQHELKIFQWAHMANLRMKSARMAALRASAK